VRDKVNFRCGCAYVRFDSLYDVIPPLAFIGFRHCHNELSETASEF
jgi:hypothetical protein